MTNLGGGAVTAKVRVDGRRRRGAPADFSGGWRAVRVGCAGGNLVCPAASPGLLPSKDRGLLAPSGAVGCGVSPPCAPERGPRVGTRRGSSPWLRKQVWFRISDKLAAGATAAEPEKVSGMFSQTVTPRPRRLSSSHPETPSRSGSTGVSAVAFHVALGSGPRPVLWPSPCQQ